MSSLGEAIDAGEALDTQRPWRRVKVDATGWSQAARAIAEGGADLLALWSDGADVLMCAREPDGAPVVLSLPAPSGRFPSVGRLHPPAERLERALRDIYGLAPQGLDDDRPWLDHGVWGVAHPGAEAEPGEPAPLPYDFLPAEGEPLHRIPVGPVHAGIIEPGHFRFSANGETVVRLEERLGYVHKGVETILRGADLAKAARIAGRVSGDSTVAYAFAFSGAVEAALGVEISERAKMLRGIMAELERIANHLGDIGAICNDAAYSLMLAHCAVLREQILRACAACFGHRLMMDRIAPGGVACDLDRDGVKRIQSALDAIDAQFPNLVALYDSTTSLQDRTVATGRVREQLVKQYAAGGYVGRASNRDFDVRRMLPYAPYDTLELDPIVRTECDVDARVRVRIDEVVQSVGLIRHLLVRLPDEPVMVDLPVRAGEGVALIEGFRGDIFAWVRIGADGKVAHCHLRDPSWFQWPLLEAAIEGNIVADFPLCNKSFNCSYSGHDL